MIQQLEMHTDFASAYINTNEDLRWAVSAIPHGARVLTVTGSGDQALFYHLAGAKKIDTFDMSLYAGLIQEIKTAAIQTLTHSQYKETLRDLSLGFKTAETRIRNMNKIIPNLNTRNQELLTTPTATEKFLISSYVESANPNNQEYKKLQTTAPKSFSFTHSRLDQLHNKIHTQYDIINISNIFDYCYTPNEKIKIMMNLTPLLTIGGRILYMPQYNTLDYSQVNILNQKNGTHLAYDKTITNPNDKWSQIISLQRIR